MTIQLTTNTIKLLIIDKTKKECHISFHFRNGLVQFFLHNLDIRASYNLQEDYLMENVPVNVFAYNLSCFLGFPVSYDDVLDMKEVFSLWNFEEIEDLLSFIKDNKIGWYEEWTEVSYKVYEELKEKGEASALETEKVEKEIENRYFFNPKTNNLFKKLEAKTDTVKE